MYKIYNVAPPAPDASPRSPISFRISGFWLSSHIALIREKHSRIITIAQWINYL